MEDQPIYQMRGKKELKTAEEILSEMCFVFESNADKKATVKAMEEYSSQLLAENTKLKEEKKELLEATIELIKWIPDKHIAAKAINRAKAAISKAGKEY